MNLHKLPSAAAALKDLMSTPQPIADIVDRTAACLYLNRAVNRFACQAMKDPSLQWTLASSSKWLGTLKDMVSFGLVLEKLTTLAHSDLTFAIDMFSFLDTFVRELPTNSTSALPYSRSFLKIKFESISFAVASQLNYRIKGEEVAISSLEMNMQVNVLEAVFEDYAKNSTYDDGSTDSMSVGLSLMSTFEVSSTKTPKGGGFLVESEDAWERAYNAWNMVFAGALQPMALVMLMVPSVGYAGNAWFANRVVSLFIYLSYIFIGGPGVVSPGPVI